MFERVNLFEENVCSETTLDPQSKMNVHRVSKRRKSFSKKGSFGRFVPNVSRILLPENMNVFNFEYSKLEDLDTSQFNTSPRAFNLVSASSVFFLQKHLNQVLTLKH